MQKDTDIVDAITLSYNWNPLITGQPTVNH